MSDSLALYIHWPFCLAKCPYCDFNSHVRDHVDQAVWCDALVREIEHYAGLTGIRTLSSIFFGGGTPSLMDPDTVAAVIESARKNWRFAPAIEITLEANPTSVEAGKFRAFRQAGVNRVSLGVQALNDDVLKFLGRQHTAAEALKAVSLANEFFDSTSFDLIYARPGQDIAEWTTELTAALRHAKDHLSLYQLTIEEGTPFYTRHLRGEFSIPGDDLGGALYEVTQDMMTAAGLPAYEVSNHARPGAESRHNLTYWRYGDYAGVGPGAHGRLCLDGKKYATRAHRAPDIWLDRIAKSGHGAHPFEEVPPKDQALELLMMGLRLTEGVPLSRLAALGVGFDRKIVEKLAAYVYISDDQYALKTTPAGRQRLDSLLPRLMEALTHDEHLLHGTYASA